MKKNARIGIFVFLSLMIVLAACAPKEPVSSGKTSTGLEASEELKKFSSSKEVIEFLKQSQSTSGNYYGGFAGRGVMMAVEEADMDSTASKAAAPTAGAADYSQTNVQVQGVDEADFVKNDGKYIYTLSGNKLVIVDAYPAEDAEILSETEIKGRPRDMFVNKDVLVVMAEGDDQVLAIDEYDFVPRPRYTQKTHAIVFNIQNREKPVLEKDFDVSGYYYQSRMIGDYINSKYERAIALKVLKENIKWLKEDAEADKRDVEVSVIDMHLKWQGGYGELVSVDRDDSVE